MALVKVFYLRPLDRFAAAAPATVHLDAYVDDLTLSAIGPKSRIIIDIALAHGMLKKVVVDELDCEFAPGKASIIASTQEAAAAIARSIGVPHEAARAQCLLGVDIAAGAARRVLRKRSSKKAARMRAALARKGRLKRLQAAVGRNANKIFRVGVLPAAAYDSPIWGVDEQEALKLRRLASAAMTPKARGRSLDMVHLWHQLPTADAEIAPIVQYSRMVWAAITSRENAAARGASLADLRRMWESASPGFGAAVKRWRDARSDSGTVPRRKAQAIWGSVRGPMGAAALSLARVGWTFAGPFVVHDDKGAEVVLTKSSPAMMRGLLRDAVRRMYERRVAARLAGKDPAFSGRRACLDLVIRETTSRKRTTAAQAGAVRAAACGALMTQERAKRLGYLSDGLCPLCRRAPDVIGHRIYGCEKTEGAVRAAVPAWFWRESQRGEATGARRTFWTSCIMPHPADAAPPPLAEFRLQVEVVRSREEAGEGARRAARRNGCGGLGEDDPRDPHLKAQVGGWVYFDGSCRPSPIRDLARAGCSIVEVDEEGDMVRSLEAVVPWHLPQTAQCAEYLSMALGFTYVNRCARFVGDCLGVVNAMRAKPGRAGGAQARYAGLVMDTHKVPERRRLVEEVRWVRAHRAITGKEDASERRDIKANAKADELAKSAVDMHPSLGAELLAEVDYYVKRAPHVVSAIAAALELFPPAPKSGGRPPRPTTERQAKERGQHMWRFSAGTWRCTICRDWLNARVLPRYRRRQACRGCSIDDDAARLAANGHTLCSAVSVLPFVICTACGAWGNRRTRRLAAPCGAPTAAGAQAVKRVARGLHPMLRKDANGQDLPRDYATITHYFSVSRGEWCAVNPAEGEPPIAGVDARGGGGPGTGGTSDAAPGPSAAGAANADGVEGDDVGMIGWDTVADDPWDNEIDIFGHGGGFDEEVMHGPAAPPEGGSAADHGLGSAFGTDGALGASARGARSSHEEGREVIMPSGTEAPSRRQTAARRGGQAVDFVARAIDGVMQGARPCRGDAPARMAALRDRIRARAAAAKETATTTCREQDGTEDHVGEVTGAAPAGHGRRDAAMAPVVNVAVVASDADSAASRRLPMNDPAVRDDGSKRRRVQSDSGCERDAAQAPCSRAELVERLAAAGARPMGPHAVQGRRLRGPRLGEVDPRCDDREGSKRRRLGRPCEDPPAPRGYFRSHGGNGRAGGDDDPGGKDGSCLSAHSDLFSLTGVGDRGNSVADGIGGGIGGAGAPELATAIMPLHLAESERRCGASGLGDRSGADAASWTHDAGCHDGACLHAGPAAVTADDHPGAVGGLDPMPGLGYAGAGGDDQRHHATSYGGPRADLSVSASGGDASQRLDLATAATRGADGTCFDASVYSAAAGSGTAASGIKRAGDLLRGARATRRRIVGKQCRPLHYYSNDDAPHAVGRVSPAAPVPTVPVEPSAGSDLAVARRVAAVPCTRSTCARSSASPAALGRDGAADEPPDRGPSVSPQGRARA